MVAERVARKVSHTLKHLIKDELGLLPITLFDQALHHSCTQLVHRHASDLPSTDLNNETALLESVGNARLNHVVSMLGINQILCDRLYFCQKLLSMLLGEFGDRCLNHSTAILIKRQ